MISLKSKTTQKLLNYFFLNPRECLYIRELARLLELDPKNVDRKLKELEKEKVLQSEFQGKQRYFSLVQNSPIVNIYRKLLSQTSGLELQLRNALNNVAGLCSAYLYGSYANNTMDAGSDVDILAIGNHSVLALQKAIRLIQKNSGREFNIINMTEGEFKQKQQNKNPFLSQIFKNKIIKLL